jgi:hypothetical protein
MKQFLLLVLTAFTFMMFGISQCNAATKCERDYSGGLCCWDIEKDGVFKPINC